MMHITVLEGTFFFAVSDKFDLSLLKELKARSSWHCSRRRARLPNNEYLPMRSRLVVVGARRP